MTTIKIDIRSMGATTHPDDRVVMWAPEVRARIGGGLVSTAPFEVELIDGQATVGNAEPGPLMVRFECLGVSDTSEKRGIVPDSGEVTLDDVLELKFTWTPPVMSASLRQIVDEMNRAITAVGTAVDGKLGGVVRRAERSAAVSASSAESADTRASSAESAASTALARVTALESIAGLSTESPVDGQTANLILQSDTLTRAALDNAIDDHAEGVKTAFEQSGIPVSVDKEPEWWARLARKSSRVRVETVGTSVEGRPIELISIGYPAPPVDAAVVDSQSLLVVATQQGGEPAPREAVMQVARDLATTEDPDLIEYLRTHPVYMMPTVCPDGEAVGSYENANGVNINRDHLALAEPETQALHEVIRRVRPHLIQDMHESGIQAAEFMVVAGRYAGAHPAINQITNEIYVAATRAVAATGSTVAEYGGSSQEPRALHIAGQLAICPVSVFESRSRDRTMGQRVSEQKTGLMATIEYHRTNTARVEAAVRALRAAPPTTAYLQHSNQLTPAPAGYQMTSAQWAQVQDTFAIHGLQVTPSESDYLVTLDQWSGWLVPNLLDPTASWPIGQGERLSAPLPDYVVPEVREEWPVPDIVDPDPVSQIYTKIFGDDPLGSVTSGMSSMLDGDVPVIVDCPGARHDKALDLSGYVVSGLAITAALTDPLVADSEILFRWKSADFPSAHGPSAFARMAGNFPNHDGYRGGYRHVSSPAPASGAAQLVAYSAGAAVVLGVNVRFPVYERETWYLTRFRVEGELLTLTIWEDGADGDPLLDQRMELDSRFEDGWAGIGADGASGFVVDWMVHATGGARAPRPLES